MAINKKKNVLIQVTFPKEDAHYLQTLVEAFNKEGIKVSKSDILVHALREYIKQLVLADAIHQKHEDKVVEPQGEKENA